MITKEEVIRMKNIFKAQEAQRNLEEQRKLEVEKKLAEMKEREEDIIEEESLPLEVIYGEEEVAIKLAEVHKYISSYVLSNNDTHNITNYTDAGNFLLGKGMYDQAMFAYKKAIECGKSNVFFQINFYPAPYLGIGRIFEQKGQNEKALAFFNKAIKMKDEYNENYDNNRNPRYTNLSSMREDSSSQLEAQVSQCNKSIATAYLYKAAALKKLEAYDQALENFDEVIKYNKFVHQAYLDKAAILQELKRFGKAINTYDELVEISPSYLGEVVRPNAYYSKAQILKIIGNHAKEIEALDNFIKAKNECKSPVNISFKEAYLNKAEALENLGKIQEANYSKGLALYFSNEYEKAICFFDEALKHNSEDVKFNNIAFCYFYKGCSLSKLGDLDKEFAAIECFRNAFENVQNQNIRILLDAFINLQEAVIAEWCDILDNNNTNNINKSALHRNECIEKFNSDIVFNLNSLNYATECNIELLIEQISTFISQQSLETNMVDHQLISIPDATSHTPVTGEIDESLS